MMTWPVIAVDDVAWVDRAGMVEIDRMMIDDVGVSLLQMMENAGRWLAEVVRVEGDRGAQVVVLAGGGGNGGGGLVSARHLTNAGFDVRVVMVAERDRLVPAARHQLAILERMGVPVSVWTGASSFVGAEVIVDAMVGYSAEGRLRGRALEAADAVRASAARVVSLDLPSGTFADRSGGAESSVVSDVTVTLCLPKVGLRDNPRAGRVLLADISVPAAVTALVAGGPVPPFWLGPVLELRAGVSSAV